MLKRVDFLALSPADRCRQVADYIEQHPGEYDQQRWSCCVGAIACRMAGYEPHDSMAVFGSEGQVSSVPIVAASLLGLPVDSSLFWALTTDAPKQLREYANAHG